MHLQRDELLWLQLHQLIKLQPRRLNRLASALSDTLQQTQVLASPEPEPEPEQKPLSLSALDSSQSSSVSTFTMGGGY